MLLRVLKKDFTFNFRQYGEITIPKGTLTSHKTAIGDDPAYNFICEFDWIDRLYPNINKFLKSDVDIFGINIPEEMLMYALRVKFLYDNSEFCRDLFFSRHTNKKYCRMESSCDVVDWYSVTPDYEEPDCPLRTDMLIQIFGRDGKVAVTEQRSEVNGHFKTEKKCLFSWEIDEEHELSECSKPIY